MSKVITVTANTAIDRLVVKSAVQPHAASTTAMFPAGKGINVARTVSTLGSRVVAIGFVGKSEADYFRGISKDNLDVQLIAVDGQTRINTTTWDAQAGITTHERARGFSVSRKDTAKLADLLARVIQPGDAVVISGSLPDGAPPDTYRTLIEMCGARGIVTILDSSKDELRLGLEAHPFVIKPNLQELQEVLNCAIDPADETALAMAAEKALSMGPELVVLSRGEHGTIVVGNGLDSPLAGHVELDRPPAASGAVGSGDALVGAFAAGLVTRKPLEDTLRLAIACGAANALSLGPGNCDPADIQQLLPRVTLRRL